jgi:hypothetical protein
MRRQKPSIDTGTPEELAVITKTKEFRAATKQQQVFVLAFLATGDARQAMAKAYPKSSGPAMRALQWQVLRSQGVTDVLEILKWRNSREALITIIKEQLKAAAPGSIAAKDFAVSLERLLLGISGTNRSHFVDPDEPDAEPVPPVETGTAVKTGTTSQPAQDSRVPADATPLVDAQGIVRGYKTQAGEYVQLAEVEATR